MRFAHIHHPAAIAGILTLAAITILIDGTIFAQLQPRLPNGEERDPFGNRQPSLGFAEGPPPFRNVAQQAFRSIVSIESLGLESGSRACRGITSFRHRGTGFVVGPGNEIVTSSRVVVGADRVRIRAADGTTYLASSMVLDPLTDLAILRFTPPLDLPRLRFADSDALAVGDWVLAVSNEPSVDSFVNPHVAAGVISSRGPGPGIAHRADLLETDIPLDSVAAGSPLLNVNGEVVGIHSALGADSDSAPHGGVIVPSNLLNQVSRQLIESGTVRRAYLGLSTQPVDPQLGKLLELPQNSGALVNQVIPESPAAKAKLQPGDVVQSINGIPITDGHRLQSFADQLPIGQQVPVEIFRGTNRQTLNIVPAEIPASLLPVARPRQINLNTTANRPISNFTDLGIGIKPLIPESAPAWARQPAARGVLVDTVKPGSPGYDAGLRPGMIIESVGGNPVSSPADLGIVNVNWANSAGVLMLARSSRGSRFLIVGGTE
jgi:serine protease Do